MGAAWQACRQSLQAAPRRWLVTGAAGFIGSNLVEQLLALDQQVVAMDNYETGFRHNLDDVRRLVTPAQWARLQVVEGDIRRLSDCRSACEGIELVLHQAALGSVPRSLSDPIATNATNVDGFLNMLVAARDAGVARFVYAASSSTYGDHPGLPKVEDRIGRPLSPYAVTKFVNELYADVFARHYGLRTVGLRYFNVFGPRQDPQGAYAAVIPRWCQALLAGEPVYVNGDGATSRDFCFIANAVQANLLAATVTRADAVDTVYNVAVGDRTTLNELYAILRGHLAPQAPDAIHREFRSGDVRHSQADITRARERLGYEPTHDIHAGLALVAGWYRARASGSAA